MSYDVDIGGESFNYTSDVLALFYDHMPAECSHGGIHELHGLTGAQASRLIGQTFGEIERSVLALRSVEAVGEPQFCAKYDAPNGWGSTIGAMLFLARIQAACIRNPRKKVKVCA